MSLNQQYAATLGDLLMRQADVQAESARERARIGNAKGQLWGNFLGGIAKLITEAPERDLQRQETAARLEELGARTATLKANAQKLNDERASDDALTAAINDPENAGDVDRIYQTVAKQFPTRAQEFYTQAQKFRQVQNGVRQDEWQIIANALQGADKASDDSVKNALAIAKLHGASDASVNQAGQMLDSLGREKGIDQIIGSTPDAIKAKQTAAAKAAEPFTLNQGDVRYMNGQPVASNPKPEAPAPAKSLSQQLAEAKTPDEVKRITGLMRTEALARHVTDPKPSAGEQGVVDLSPAGLDAAAQMYAQTGQLPPMGMGMAAGSARTRIINRAAELFPGLNVASNKAGYTADSGSLSAIQKQRDSISAFENTAQKNIDQFLKVAQAVPDTGIPLLNTPARWAAGAAGSEAQAKYAAARQVAISEIAKIVQNPTLAGQLSDSARHEIEVFNPQNATLKQTVAVMNLLKQDMKNRADSLDTQLKDIRGRIGGAQGQNATPAAPAGSTGPQVGSVVTYNGKRYRVKSITNGRADLEAVQ